MCGRVRVSSDVSEIKLVFSIPPDRPTPNFPPSWFGVSLRKPNIGYGFRTHHYRRAEEGEQRGVAWTAPALVNHLQIALLGGSGTPH
jgi:hypothetical protein